MLASVSPAAADPSVLRQRLPPLHDAPGIVSTVGGTEDWSRSPPARQSGGHRAGLRARAPQTLGPERPDLPVPPAQHQGQLLLRRRQERRDGLQAALRPGRGRARDARLVRGPGPSVVGLRAVIAGADAQIAALGLRSLDSCPFCGGAISPRYAGIRDRLDTTTETFEVHECADCGAGLLESGAGRGPVGLSPGQLPVGRRRCRAGRRRRQQVSISSAGTATTSIATTSSC